MTKLSATASEFVMPSYQQPVHPAYVMGHAGGWPLPGGAAYTMDGGGGGGGESFLRVDWVAVP
eukprot:SAG25_NODE_11109_length_313_cov_1.056075_2_plen_62_part_01